MPRRKIALIGAGQIGGSVALIAAERNLGNVVLFDVFGGTAKGKALDINQAAALCDNDTQLIGTDSYADIADADVCIVTAGFPRKPGMSRDDLLTKNLEVIHQVAAGIREYAPNAFIIVVTNPLDVMVYALKEHGGFDRNRVVGMAGVLDSARFRTFLSWELKISRDDVRAFVMGGHGDDMVPLPRFSSAGGIPLPTLIEMGLLSEQKLAEIVTRTRKGGGEIVELLGNGSAFYTPALAAVEMAQAYLNDTKRLLPCAAYLDGEYGVKDLFVGVPVVIGAGGVERILELKLDGNEKVAFAKSIESVRKVIDEMKQL